MDIFHTLSRRTAGRTCVRKQLFAEKMLQAIEVFFVGKLDDDSASAFVVHANIDVGL
jgi:hypothetical protein